MAYKFYGWESREVSPAASKYFSVKNQKHLYDLLSECWSADTCAPRMRERWSESNRTLGQCSITAFLVQDIFGGEVYGVALPDGNFHCYNVVGDSIFDLTSEQFGDEKLIYDKKNPQSRQTHFSKSEKKKRYEVLKARLMEIINIS